MIASMMSSSGSWSPHRQPIPGRLRAPGEEPSTASCAEELSRDLTPTKVREPNLPSRRFHKGDGPARKLVMGGDDLQLSGIDEVGENKTRRAEARGAVRRALSRTALSRKSPGASRVAIAAGTMGSIMGPIDPGECRVLGDDVASGRYRSAMAVPHHHDHEEGSPLIVVMGHSHCGAVSAACDVVTKNATFPRVDQAMIDPIVPAAIATRDAPGELLDNAVPGGAQRTAARLGSTSCSRRPRQCRKAEDRRRPFRAGPSL